MQSAVNLGMFHRLTPLVFDKKTMQSKHKFKLLARIGKGSLWKPEIHPLPTLASKFSPMLWEALVLELTST
jgi:hypothetical protein